MEPQHAFLALIGLGFAVVPPFQVLRQRRESSRRTRRVHGRVIGHRTETFETLDRTDGATQHARVEYEVDGESYVAVSRYGASWKTSSVGERMEVLYDPRDPSDGEVLSETGRRLETLVCFAVLPAIGLAMAIAGARHLFA